MIHEIYAYLNNLISSSFLGACKVKVKVVESESDTESLLEIQDLVLENGV